MNEVEFWKIIGLLGWDETGDYDAVVEPVVNLLSERSVAEIDESQQGWNAATLEPTAGIAYNDPLFIKLRSIK